MIWFGYPHAWSFFRPSVPNGLRRNCGRKLHPYAFASVPVEAEPREIEGGEETCEVELPLVVSAQKGMAEARIPNMRGIMAARTKPLKVVEPVAAESLTTVAGFGLPPTKSGVKLVAADNVEELVRLLHEEAKAI